MDTYEFLVPAGTVQEVPTAVGARYGVEVPQKRVSELKGGFDFGFLVTPQLYEEFGPLGVVSQAVLEDSLIAEL
ncbi:hypothetical protein [Streptomyces sp. NPDC092129]|uniref:hypothetical protein n=1 Tax=Streptomyces sp. NPDC092129 TaxID=3366010 RepID=UPI0037FDBA85